MLFICMSVWVYSNVNVSRFIQLSNNFYEIQLHSRTYIHIHKIYASEVIQNYRLVSVHIIYLHGSFLKIGLDHKFNWINVCFKNYGKWRFYFYNGLQLNDHIILSAVQYNWSSTDFELFKFNSIEVGFDYKKMCVFFLSFWSAKCSVSTHWHPIKPLSCLPNT